MFYRKRQIFIYINDILYIGKSMQYVVISEEGQVNIFESSEKLDEFLAKSNGVFYIVNLYGKYVYVEKYTVKDGKIYRVESVKL